MPTQRESAALAAGVTKAVVTGVASMLLLAACATRSDEVAPQPTDAATYAALSCDALYDEADRIRVRAARVAYAVDERFGTNIVALGMGVSVFWPALLAMRPAGADAAELAQLKGRDEAVRSTMAARSCPPPPEQLSAVRAAALPVAVGERLVYEERAQGGGPARVLALRVVSLRREGIDFALDADGAPRRWRQDPFGNLPQAPEVGGYVHWRRLLQPEMALGTVLAGDLVGGDGQVRGRLRGQVIALGVQTSLGRPFDAAVIELFGDAPLAEDGAGTRLDGVMVVDRKSGVLLRLELRSGSPAYALRRTLMRIEPPATAAGPGAVPR
jgi:hypothetical protein